MENFETMTSEICLSVFKSLFHNQMDVWSALDAHAMTSPDTSLSQAIDQLLMSIKSGTPPEEALHQSELFQKSEFLELVTLLNESTQQPQRVPALWIAWACKNGRVPWTDGTHWSFLKTFMDCSGSLWLTGECAEIVDKVFSHCQKLSPYAELTAFTSEDMESFKLKCKRGKLVFSKPKIILWIETDGNGDPVIIRVDEWVYRKAGLIPISQAIFWLSKNLELLPTGVLPSCIELSNSEPPALSVHGRTLDPTVFTPVR